MRFFCGLLWLMLVLTTVELSRAQDCGDGSYCVPKEDLAALVEIAREKKCLQEETPKLELDPIDIIVDHEGRIFFSGDQPRPYKLKMHWCNYEMGAEGKVKVVAAVQEPPSMGFRFRPKAYVGALLVEPFREEKELKDAIDAGLMIDPVYIKDFNLNFHVGFRSVGVGIGLDVFRSFGFYSGYAVTWDGPHHNPMAAFWFSFW